VGLYNAFGPGGSHGYLDDGGSFGTIDVPFLGASSTYALGINARGQIVGGFASSGRRAFLYEQGAFTTIDVPFTGAFSTTAFAINDGGQIVGTYYDDLNNPHRHGFLYDRGIFTTIDVPFPGASLVDFYGITGINNRGQITGNYMDSPCTSQSCVQHGFLYDGGEFVTIDFPGFPFTSVGGINNRGQFVGSYCAGGVFPPSCHVFMATPNDDGREHDISGAY
jgi:probable HAF family extracellular repeat protein